jgi:MtN3 and saliva related transmembrane protein
MAAILAIFQILWVIYGLMIGSGSVVAWNVIAIVINSLTVGAYCYFARAEARAKGNASALRQGK